MAPLVICQLSPFVDYVSYELQFGIAMNNPALREADSPDLRSVRIFLTVCETLNMTEAARRLGITQSAVSHSISSFERFVQEPLFDRQTRPMSLTPAGFALFEAGQRVDVSFQSFQTTIKKVKAGRIPHLRIGLTSSLPATLAPMLIERMNDYVDQATIRNGLTPDLRNFLATGEVDMSVMIDRQSDAHLVTHPVLTEPYLVAAPASFGQIETLSDLLELSRKFPLVRWIGGYMGRDIEVHLRRLRITPPQRYALDDRNAIMHMVRSGLGWAIITPLSAFDIWQPSTNIQLHPFPGAIFQHKLVAAHKPGQFAWMAKRCAHMVREIVQTGFLPSLSERAPWLGQSIILTAQEMDAAQTPIP